MEVLSPSTPNGLAASPNSATADPLDVLEHIASLIQATLGAARRELEAVGSLLSKAKHSDAVNRCARFASENQVALYAQKDYIDDKQTNGHDEDSRRPSFHVVFPKIDPDVAEPEYSYTLSSLISFSPETVASVAFIKRAAPLDSRIPIASQVQVINLPGLAALDEKGQSHGNPVSPFEVLHSIVHLALGPYFDAHTRSRDHGSTGRYRTDPDARGGVPGAKKKFTELEMSLLHLQQNIEIPALHLPFHEVVQEALDEAKARDIRPSIRLLPSAVLENSM